MFENCVSLQNVIGYDSYYFYQTEDFAYMFKNCSSLEKMVIGSHSIQSARYLTGMFEGCSKAKDITFYFNHFNGVYNYDNFLGPDFELAKSGVIKLVNYNSTRPSRPTRFRTFSLSESPASPTKKISSSILPTSG